MSKKTKITDIEKSVMKKIKKGEIKMKPKILFILGSILMTIGIIATIIVSIIFLSINIFSLRLHGPLYQTKTLYVFQSLPWWALVIALIGIIGGYFLLKKYDFSYKKNFKLIVIFLVICIIISAYFIDYFNLNNLFLRQPPFRGFYQEQFDKACKYNPDCRLNPRINREFNDKRIPMPKMLKKQMINPPGN